ncbi:MAG: hypothetical protein NXI12_11700 [Alphaproteobacteria bacterium]|nr:hypothetical protein [Alphaproteobacteria bacterium]
MMIGRIFGCFALAALLASCAQVERPASADLLARLNDSAAPPGQRRVTADRIENLQCEPQEEELWACRYDVTYSTGQIIRDASTCLQRDEDGWRSVFSCDWSSEN